MAKHGPEFRIGVWRRPAFEHVRSSFSAIESLTVVPLDDHEIEVGLRGGELDAGFVPLLTILRQPDDYVAAPGIGITSTTSYSHASVRYRTELDGITTIGFDPRLQQEALLTQIILKENYGAKDLQFKPIGTLDQSPGSLETDSWIDIADDTQETGSEVLSLNQEWYELSAYPFVWALLVTRSGIPGAQDLLELSASHLRSVASTEGPGLVLGEDELAGIDEFATYLFYHGSLDEIPVIPFADAASEPKKRSGHV